MRELDGIREKLMGYGSTLQDMREIDGMSRKITVRQEKLMGFGSIPSVSPEKLTGCWRNLQNAGELAGIWKKLTGYGRN